MCKFRYATPAASTTCLPSILPPGADFFRQDIVFVVSECIADIAEYGGDFFVFQEIMGRHHLVVGFAVHRDAAGKAFEDDLYQLFFIRQPGGIRKGRVHAGHAVAIGLVTGQAVAVIDLLSQYERAVRRAFPGGVLSGGRKMFLQSGGVFSGRFISGGVGGVL